MGYINYSESVNSYNAKQDGRFPKTLFKKEWNLSEKKFHELVNRGLIAITEWHHTSKEYNRTNFYGIQNMPVFLMAIGQKEKAFSFWMDLNKGKYVVKHSCDKVSKFTWNVIVSKQDTNLHYLVNLGLKFYRTKSNNYSFYLHDNKSFLNNPIVRELFTKSPKFKYV